MAGGAEFPSRGFWLYWQAGAVSGFGSYITLLALQTLVVLTLHGSAVQVGWLNAARWLPYLVAGVVVGALVDRHRRRPVMIATDLAQAVLLVTIPVLWWLHLLSLLALLGIVIVYGTASVISDAATMAYLPRLVEPRFLQRAHARTDGTDAVAMTAGLASILTPVPRRRGAARLQRTGRAGPRLARTGRRSARRPGRLGPAPSAVSRWPRSGIDAKLGG